MVVLVPSPLARVSHNTVDPVSQRPTAATGIFELEVITAGTRLRGRVLVRQSLLAALAACGDPWEALSGPARLGARRHGEYGAVTVSVEPARPAPDVPVPAETCTLWAVSDLVVRNTSGRQSADPRDAVAAVGRKLGITVDLVSATTRTRRRDGWQGKWQLPRESIVGLAAGTVLQLRFPQGTPAPEAWKDLFTKGIGDRTAEGYGELVAGAPLLDVTKATKAEPERRTTPFSSEVDNLPPAVRTAVITERARAVLPDTRDTPEYAKLAKVLSGLSRSQRGDWRAATVAAAVAGELTPITARIDQVSWGNLPRRQNERVVAQILNYLIGRRTSPDVRSWWHVLAERGVEVTTGRDRAAAIAALVADVIDGLRREGGADDRAGSHADIRA
jgi:CRISPR-associated protein Csx10